jgi:5-formyltetrahydrofolate cyclo-ligase
MKNVEELRTRLSEVFIGLQTGAIKHKDAAELANLAGKMINSAKVQVEYYALRKEAPVIPFLGAATTKTNGKA